MAINHKKHTTYKLADDSLEYLIKEYQESHRNVVLLCDRIKQLEAQKLHLQENINDLEKKITYLLKERKIKEITVNLVTYKLDSNNQLVKEIKL